MKRSLFILGILIILTLTGVLVFLLFANDSTKDDIFSKFDLNGTEEGGGIGEALVDLFVPEDNTPQALRQLTLKPVIGSTEITATASSTGPTIYFAEAGTGHIFALDVVSGNETRISNITLPTAQKAAISKDGSLAAVASDINQSGYKLTVVLLSGEGESLESYEIDERVKDFTITADNQLLYSTTLDDSLLGKSHDVTNKTTDTLFKLPFKEAVVLWGASSTDPIYTYPKTSAQLEGYLYQIQGGVLQRLPISGFGLSVGVRGNSILYSVRQDDNYSSYSYDLQSGNTTQLFLSLLPEKCARQANNSTTLVCGGGYVEDINNFPDSWYQGAISFTDDLWLLDIYSDQQTLLLNTRDASGRELDVIMPTLSLDEQRFYFVNKNDNSFWVLDRSLINQE